MTYYIAGLLRIRETGWLAEYQQRLPAVVKRHGGEILAAGAPDRLEGVEKSPDRLIVMQFPSREAALAWYADDDHSPLIELRKTGADLDLLGTAAAKS
ncbi:MAG: DUF1330 domain-containing protein [Parvibaculum sp.]|uniref:DUF1330 domain-containing protein n=1 Tax=Parvibaculum sp. TaxID=2024848 RepID=UPI002AB8AC48|nr:DUF1330 domain-containing protein [Parvibaculum sp.]MDZ4381983.1 DUF1330 domain-containing protein [Parvibaculum sp.]